MEHRLAGEKAADRHAIEPSRQLTVHVPDLDGVCPPQAVQVGVGVDELLGDPAIRTVGIGTAPDDGLEVLVDGDQVTPS